MSVVEWVSRSIDLIFNGIEMLFQGAASTVVGLAILVIPLIVAWLLSKALLKNPAEFSRNVFSFSVNAVGVVLLLASPFIIYFSLVSLLLPVLPQSLKNSTFVAIAIWCASLAIPFQIFNLFTSLKARYLPAPVEVVEPELENTASN